MPETPAKTSIYHKIIIAFSCLALAGCAEANLASHYAKQATRPASSGLYKVGSPYTIAGETYYPREDFTLVETGIASWYGPGFHGKKTANGERFDQNELTAAHRTLPMPSLVRVTNLENGRSVVVRINDRGPFKRGRVIDLSKRGADLLGFIGQGTARVRVEVLSKESRQIAEAAKRGVDTSRMTIAELQQMARRQGAASSAPVAATYVPPPRPVPVQMATLRNDAEALPESLRTPTITVEELASPGIPAGGRQVNAPHAPVQGHVAGGNFIPDAVVTTAPVRQTGLFVQAGSFSVRENATRLGQKLQGIGPVTVDEVRVSGQTFYRVKLGPLANVAEADRVLAAVVRAGHGTARVVK